MLGLRCKCRILTRISLGLQQVCRALDAHGATVQWQLSDVRTITYQPLAVSSFQCNPVLRLQEQLELVT